MLIFSNNTKQRKIFFGLRDSLETWGTYLPFTQENQE